MKVCFTVAVALMAAVTVQAAIFGPDNFGHIGIDIYEPDGPVYNLYDIRPTGLLVASGDDTAGSAALGAPFSFYGVDYTELRASTNGYLSTDMSDSGGDLSNDWPLPAPPSTGGGGRFYPLHDDLVSDPGVWYEYFASSPVTHLSGQDMGASIFQWESYHYGDVEIFEFQAVLFDNGDILFQIGAGNPEQGSGSTTGIMDPTYTDALGIYGNQAGSIPDNYAVHIFVPEPASLSLLVLGGLALLRRR